MQPIQNMNNTNQLLSLQKFPEDCHREIAQYLGVADLTRYIQELKAGKTLSSIFISQLNAVLIDKLQLESSSFYPILRLGKNGRNELYLRLINEGTTREYVTRLNFEQVGIEKEAFMKNAPLCSKINELNMGEVELSDPELVEFIGKFPDLARFGYVNLVQLKSLTYLLEADCIELGAGRVPRHRSNVKGVWELFFNTVISNPNVSSNMTVFDIKYIEDDPIASRLRLPYSLSLEPLPKKAHLEQIFTYCANLTEVNLFRYRGDLSVLEFLPKNIKKLNLQWVNLEAKHIKMLPKNLMHLSLGSILYSGDIFKHFHSLIELKTGIIDEHSLSHLPTSLKKLHFEPASIRGKQGIIRSLPPTLEELIIWDSLYTRGYGPVFESKELPRSLTRLHVILRGSLHVAGGLFGSSSSDQWPPNLVDLKLGIENIHMPFTIPKSVKNLTFAVDHNFYTYGSLLQPFPADLEELKFEGGGGLAICMIMDSVEKMASVLQPVKSNSALSTPIFKLLPPIPLSPHLKTVVLPRRPSYLRPCVDPYQLFSGYSQDFRILMPIPSNFNDPKCDMKSLEEWCKQHRVKLIA